MPDPSRPPGPTRLADVPTPWSKMGRDEFTEVYRVYDVPVRNEVARVLRAVFRDDPALADEIAQDVKTALLLRMRDGRATPNDFTGPLRAYLRGACRKAVQAKVRQLVRGWKRVAGADPDALADDGDGPDAAPFARDWREAVLDVVIRAVAEAQELLAGSRRWERRKALLDLLVGGWEEGTAPDTAELLARLRELAGAADLRDDVFRVTLASVREQVARQLVFQVRRTLPDAADRAALVDELRRLRLLAYVERFTPDALGAA